MATGRTDPDRNGTGGSDGRDDEQTDQRPTSVSPAALTCRLRSAVGETEAVTLRVQPTEDGSEVERVLHADEALTTTAELDHHVTLACARVLVTELPGSASDVRLVRPTFRTCAADDAVAHEATFRRDGDSFVREGRRGPPTPPASAPSYTLERLRGNGLFAGLVVPFLAGVTRRLFGLRERFGDGDVTVTRDELVVRFDATAGAQQHGDIRVENGALCVWLLGETDRGDGVERSERVARIVPPFPITADGATAERTADGVVVALPRCGRGDSADGSVLLD
ncbi:hypothetical protein [Haloarchaeobius iranensis]|uniref:Uncharacterized protein n=1 Tax=Haloarchaeobius iranensis TaxID=996166 RepID=A0A1G9Z6G9_9EURY|nr:hypothetical protein [Haloarchaeobius iranensis]SDN16361.1 hypothetical protein SAMN05192554_11815 [Haloarchaeobius iranensis]